MARRSDHSREELKELILETSWEIVGKEGFEALTARHIASKIGYAPGTIYNLFKSMDDLYLQVNGRTLDALYDALAAPSCNAPSKSPPVNMKAMAATYMEFAQDYRSQWLMLFTHSLPAEKKAPAWYQSKVDRLFAPLETLLSPYFKPQQTKKKAMAARILWSSVHGLCFLQETGKIPQNGDDFAIDKMAAMLVDNFVVGLENK